MIDYEQLVFRNKSFVINKDRLNQFQGVKILNSTQHFPENGQKLKKVYFRASFHYFPNFYSFLF